MGKDYYQILGITKDAKEAEIKKAYKKQAMKWHPDKNPENKEQAEAKFKEIAEAFDVLSDPDKRKIFDQFGEEGLKGGMGGGGGGGGMPGGFRYEFRGDPDEIFRNLFRGMGGGFGGRGDDPFESMFMGGMPGMGGMGGMGGMPGMGGMGGMGGMPGMGGMGGMGMGTKRPFTADVKCSLEELYVGTTKKMKISRKSVSSNRATEHTFEINVKPGWKAGTKLTFNGEGDEYAPGQAQDVILVIKEKPHEHFQRDGHDLIYKAKCTLSEALTGFKVDVPMLDKRILRVSVKDVVHPNYSKIVKNEGMPKAKEPGSRGDLIITFDITYPKTLTDEQKAKLKEILP